MWTFTAGSFLKGRSLQKEKYANIIGNQCLQNAYNVSGTILNILYALAYLILTATEIIIIPKYMYKETDTEILSNLLEVT